MSHWGANDRIVHVQQFDVDVDKKLGEGGFGAVFEAKDGGTSQPCAAKQLANHYAREEAKKEVAVLQRVQSEGSHSNIVSVLGAVASGEWIFMELLTGGELFDLLIDSGKLSERRVCMLSQGLVAGLLHCHRLGIVHRDMKLENVMLMAEDPEAVKIIDFGLAVNIESPESRLNDTAGSKSYKAPEIYTGMSGGGGYQVMPVDSWSLGVTVLTLLAGFFPFEEARGTDWRFARYAQDVVKGTGACDSIWTMNRQTGHKDLSAPCLDFVNRLLAHDPRGRLSMADAEAHPWLKTQWPAEAEDDVVYRSCGGDGPGEPFEIPETAFRICRQRAELGREPA